MKEAILTLPGPAFRTWAPAIGAGTEDADRDGRTTTGEGLTDQQAFWELLAPCRDKLFNFIRKSLRFSTAAEDVYQETVLNAFRYFGTFKPERKFAPWIFAIAHNALRDHFRREARTSADPGIERRGGTEDERTRAMVRAVYAYADRLKPRDREVFFLFYESGFSIAEIAGVTGLGEGNIKFILHQARKRLKAALGVSDD